MARELKRRIEELREAVHESLTDDLTGLPNRRAFDVTFANRVRDLKRLGGTLGLVLLDLDNFKSINDTYGHPQGDYVLREFARVLHETSREIDHPARYGGEEFALLLPGHRPPRRRRGGRARAQRDRGARRSRSWTARARCASR